MRGLSAELGGAGRSRDLSGMAGRDGLDVFLPLPFPNRSQTANNNKYLTIANNSNNIYTCITVINVERTGVVGRGYLSRFNAQGVKGLIGRSPLNGKRTREVSMRVDLVKIQGNPVGIQVTADNDAERVLMAGLEGLVADGNRREEREAPSA